jgi:hypothetical protein
MKIPEELTNWQEFKNEIRKPILAIILLHLHWVILLGFIAYIAFDISRYLSTIDPSYP